MAFFKLIAGLAEKMGMGATGLLCIAAGMAELLNFVGIPEHLTHGIVWSAVGIAIVIVGRKSKKASDLYVAREAEKMVAGTSPPSNIPAINRAAATEEKRQTQ